MRVKKNLFALALSLCMLVVCCVPAFATAPDESVAPRESSEIQPRLNFNGPVYLTVGHWAVITGDNNFVAAELEIHSDIDNPGTVSIRVLDHERNQIGKTYVASPGETVRTGIIPAYVGNFSVEAKPISVTGTYYFTVED